VHEGADLDEVDAGLDERLDPPDLLSVGTVSFDLQAVTQAHS
jgi:hypothetical protein